MHVPVARRCKAMQGDARRWRRKREADNGIFALLALSLEACVVPNDIADALLLASMAITMLLRSDALRAEFDGVVAVALGHLGPWAAGPNPPEDAVQNPTIIYTGNPTRLVQQQRLDDRI